MIWLFLSILCSALIFVIFKFFGKYQVNNLQAIIVNYVVAFAVGWLSSGFYPNPSEISHKPWFWSIVILGFLFISLFQLMAYGSQKLGVSVVSVVVKMSLVIPVTFAVFLYGDQFTLLKIAGIIVALLSVYFTSLKKDSLQKTNKSWWLYILLFAGSGALDVLLKYNQEVLVPVTDQALFVSCIFLMAGILGMVMWLLKRDKLELKNVWAGIILGVPNYGSMYFLLKALSAPHWESSALFTLNNVGIVVTSVLFGLLFFKEKISKINLFGIALALLGIALLTTNIV